MKRVRVLFIALALTMAAVVIWIGSAAATNYLFNQQDPDMRAWATPPANHVVVWWAYGPYEVRWADNGTFTADVVQAIQSWQSAVPQFTFTYSPSPGSSSLYFTVGFCGQNATGCIVNRTFLPDAQRGASYLYTAQIWLSAPGAQTPLGRQDALRHEIGHWVGLHEQYNGHGPGETPSCSGQQSVMNMVTYPSGESCVGVHAPTAWDIEQAVRYWQGDALQDAVLFGVGGGPAPLLRLEWKDAMWAEVWHERFLWYWSPSTYSWALCDDSASYSQGIGFHRTTIDRTMRVDWDYQALGCPVNTTYIAGAQAWSWRFPGWTGLVWSGQVYVPQ